MKYSSLTTILALLTAIFSLFACGKKAEEPVGLDTSLPAPLNPDVGEIRLSKTEGGLTGYENVFISFPTDMVPASALGGDVESFTAASLVPPVVIEPNPRHPLHMALAATRDD